MRVITRERCEVTEVLLEEMPSLTRTEWMDDGVLILVKVYEIAEQTCSGRVCCFLVPILK